MVIDEAQRAPQLLSIVHGLIETKKNLRFILTGSSVRKLKRTGADLLGRRALRDTLHPFIARELDNTEALQYGMLPLVYATKNCEQTLHTYIHLYLHEEIQAEDLVRNLDNFTRFLEAV